MGRGGKVLECESPPLSAPEPQNDIGSQRDVATPGFLLTGAFHETWLWGRHCLAIANYQWHIGGLLESEGIRVSCEQNYLLGSVFSVLFLSGFRGSQVLLRSGRDEKELGERRFLEKGSKLT